MQSLLTQVPIFFAQKALPMQKYEHLNIAQYRAAQQLRRSISGTSTVFTVLSLWSLTMSGWTTNVSQLCVAYRYTFHLMAPS